MLSITSIERHNPPPRKKSCASCIKAKRRCTLETPACQRCAQRGLDCKYPEGRIAPRRRLSSIQPTLPAPPARTLTPPIQASIDQDATAYNWDVALLNITSQPSPCSQLLDIPPTVFNYTDLEPIFDFPDMPLDGFIDLYSPTPNKRIHGTHTASSTSAHSAVQWAFRNRLAYALDKIRKAPQQMLAENQTPWSHPNLYENRTPHSMLDAQASCALHLCKNQTNASLISRNIESRVQALISTPLPTSSPLDLLAHCQALLLYQIMRILDGDFRLTAAADQTTPYLEDAAAALMECNVFQFEDSPGFKSLPPSEKTAKFWEDWVLRESARRTYLMVFFFVQTYGLLKGFNVSGKCDGRLGRRNHVFTVGEKVWSARGPVEFARAWGEGRRWVVVNADALNHARGEDVDTFTKMVFTSFWGIDEVRAWLLMIGGCL
ncbi:hypothetical protein QBC44DRAFT_246495 [Cladorrhinum sp. PSN332]|nr:hypothetical protein QBC44DRAFT_246495 [Cladorrhinum sp. PSN332]